MKPYLPCEHSNSAVRKAGEFLAKKIPPDMKEEAIRCFRIAHQWRAAHMLPMERIRMSILQRARTVSPAAVSAARLKRMISIRRKLRNGMKLHAIQDIGGCRVIFESVGEICDLVGSLGSASKHEIVNAYDYITTPKLTGYRSRHLVLQYSGVNAEAAYNRHKIEVQFRTRLQHSWATAVEAVGLVRRESLKGGEGDPSWLRLFALMAGEIAAMENQPPVPGVTEDAPLRRAELKAMEVELNAIAALESYNNIIKVVDEGHRGTARHFLVQYNYDRHEVAIWPQYFKSDFIDDYGNLERNHNTDSVLVEADRIDDLRVAFPNYFLDVRLFTELLKARVAGEAVSALARRYIRHSSSGYRNVGEAVRDWESWRR